MNRNDWLGLAALAAASLFGLACGGDDSTGPGDAGRLRIIVTTEGSPLDPDGYLMMVDDLPPAVVGIADTVILDVGSGSHSLFLTGIAANCWPDRDNMEYISLPRNREQVWQRQITCEELPPPLTGTIAFTRSVAPDIGDVFLMKEDGSGQINLTNHPAYDANAQISPDGRLLAFVSDRANPTGIYRIRPDGRGVTRLSPPDRAAYWPAWSPDGMRVAFTAELFGDFSDINVVSVDGSRLTNLTPFDYSAFASTWSPDGRYMVFCTDREITLGQAVGVQLHILDLQTLRAGRLSANDSSGYLDPDWAPNGQSLAFDRNDSDPSRSNVFTMATNGTGVTQLTTTNVDFDPAWSPDGAKIAFVSERDGRRQIYVMNANGTGAINLSNGSESDVDPDWSP
jgi:TolB protein